MNFKCHAEHLKLQTEAMDHFYRNRNETFTPPSMSSFDLSAFSMFLLTPKELKGGHIRTKHCTAQTQLSSQCYYCPFCKHSRDDADWIVFYISLLLFYIKLGCKINKILKALLCENVANSDFRSKKLI